MLTGNQQDGRSTSFRRKSYRLRLLPLLVGFQAACSIHELDKAIFFSILIVETGCRGKARA